MIDLSTCHKIGYIAKAHGVKGECILRLHDIELDTIRKMEWVYLILEGLPVPFFIEQWIERPPDGIILAIEDISSPEQLAPLLSAEVYLSNTCVDSIASDTQFNLPQLVGYKVIDKVEGEIGIISAILDIQENPLFEVTTPKGDVLLPIHDDFVLEIRQETKTIVLELPSGLMDLN